MHEKFDELLRHLSFTEAYVNEVVELVGAKVKNELKTEEKRLKEIKVALLALDTRMENLESKLFTDVINDETYKRNLLKINGERAKLNQDMDYIERFGDNIQQELLVLPYMINLYQVYHDAPIDQKHAIVREVFKDGFTYSDGMFRTPSINPALTCNLLLLNKIGLLDVEQTYQNENSFSLCGEGGFRTLPYIVLIFSILCDY